MFVETKKITIQYTRTSKLGVEHSYIRNKTIVVFLCDNCGEQFERELGKMDHRRMDNNYFHVCSKCNPKQFAQSKSVEKRCFWNMPVDTDIDITRY
jgi:predicted RNA-binding Zn-ribbon protein involved in translation (DUF1610 family)